MNQREVTLALRHVPRMRTLFYTLQITSYTVHKIPHCRMPGPIYSQAPKSTKNDVVSALIPTFSLILRQNTALFEMRRGVWNFSADFRSF